MSNWQRCEWVGRSEDDRGRCREQGSAGDPTNDGMGLLPYCADCGRCLCKTHLDKHLCRDMRAAGVKRGEAHARYLQDVGD